MFYHLGDLEDALTYALGAGSLFAVTDSSEYTQTILARCIDKYTEIRTSTAESSDEGADPRLIAIIERLFERCHADGQAAQAVGIALEARRLDQLETAVHRSSDPAATLHYALSVTQRLVVSAAFREKALRLIAKMVEESAAPDYAVVCSCLAHLGDSQGLADVIVTLVKGSDIDALKAYQIAFDLYGSELSALNIKIAAVLTKNMGLEEKKGDVAVAAPATTEAGGDDAMDTDTTTTTTTVTTTDAPADPTAEKALKCISILTGKIPLELERQFLARNCQSDPAILKNLKATVEPRNSVCQGAVIFANATMHSGTTNDTFLRENMDWLSRATNWSKFSATAGLGVIHRGNVASSRTVMSHYLPAQPGGASPSAYSEGGALYALGLIHSGHSSTDIRNILLQSLRASQQEVVQHGACLGLGLTLLGSCDTEAFEDIKNILYSDNAISGSAAGIALGLLFAGSGTEYCEEMLAYAHDTQHEKIIRGLATGLSIIQYGREEAAEGAIEAMTGDLDPIIRQGGMMALGLAYRGTSNNGAVARLLHHAVSDVSNDVRRTAVMCLGFVLMNAPEQCPRIVSLLAESYNPHVRYGAAMAVGIAAAGTGLREAVAMLEPMLTDSVDFVQQGTLISLSMILCNQPAARTKILRDRIDALSGSKAVELMTRMGYIMSSGILDAGGRNASIAPRSVDGHFRRTAVIGLALFTQYWYWYPMSYTLSLTLQPTALIGVDGSLGVPSEFYATCNAKPSMFAPPPPVTVDDKRSKSKLPTAVLSTTARVKARLAKKKKKEAEAAGGVAMQTDDEPTDAADKGEGGDDANDAGEDAEEVKKTKKEEEPNSFKLNNPSRVIPMQSRYVVIPEDQRFKPINNYTAGFIVLTDSKPDEGVPEYMFKEVKQEEGEKKEGEGAGGSGSGAGGQAGKSSKKNQSGDEPPPPEPFEYIPS